MTFCVALVLDPKAVVQYGQVPQERDLWLGYFQGEKQQ